MTKIMQKLDTPRPHQSKALEGILHSEHGLLNKDRAQYISACGTGKTHVLLWSAQEYIKATNSGKIEDKVIVFLFPSLTLINQSYDTYAEQNSIPGYSPMVVCSDDKVGAKENEEDTAENCLFAVSTNQDDIEAYLNKDSISNKVIFSTYKSAHLVGAALKNTQKQADITIYDEAHRTAIVSKEELYENQSQRNAYSLYDENFPSKKRLFATATPRHYTIDESSLEEGITQSGDVVFSMDNPQIYGNIAHEYSMREAISDGVITDYKILAIAVSERDILKFLNPKKNNEHKNTEDHERMEEAAKMLAIQSAYEKYGIKNALVFNSSIDDSKQFVERFSYYNKHIPAAHIDGSMNNEQRAQKLDIFKNNDIALLSNAKLLSEGHDIPKMDFVVFNNKTKSTIDIVQRVGRVQRRDIDNPEKIGFILLPIYVDGVDADINESFKKNAGLKTLFETVNAMKEADTQLRDWIEYKKTTRQSKQVEVLPAQASEPNEKNSEEDRIIFTDYQAIQKELEEKAKAKTFVNKTPDYQEKTPAEQVQDTIDAQYAHMIRQWENKIEATLVGDPREFFAQWLEKANLLREYVSEYDKLPIATTIYKDVNIGSWLNSQKQNYKTNNLSQERIDILLNIHPNVLNGIEDQWFENANLLREYVNENNELPKSTTIYKGVKIGAWLNDQKENYKNNKLSQERIDILLDIDKDIFKTKEEINNERWLEKANLLREYVNENNELPKSTTIYKGVKIGAWLNDQKHYFKNNNLSQERINILLDIHPDTLPIGEEATHASQIESLVCPTKNEHLNANI